MVCSRHPKKFMTFTGHKEGFQMNHWMFNCNEISKKVSESFDRSLPLYQRRLIRTHLMMCKHCSRFKKQLVIIRKAIRSEDENAAGPEEASVLSSDARDRIKHSLQEQAGSHS
jgi:hypothetical protein